MRIGLMSDTHGSAKTFQIALDGVFRDVDMILHAGDVLYHGAKNPLTEGYSTMGLANLINNLSVPIMIAKGNCDSDVDQAVLNTPIMSPYVLLQIDDRKLMVLHGDGKGEEDFETLIASYDLSVVVHGHTHIARVRSVGKSLIVNPGSPTLPNASSPYKKTVAVFDTFTGRVAIHDIDTMNVVLKGSL